MRFARSLVFAVSVFALAATSARAYAPQVKTQAPGYYRFMLGSFEITALSDGTVNLPMDKLLHEKPEKTAAAMKKQFLGTTVETSVNGYLVNTGTKLVLIDTGAGAFFGPTLGKLAANLRASGYTPEQIDEIYITHAHPDHLGGLVANGAAVFPNAIVRLDQADVDYWLDPAKAAAAADDVKGRFQDAAIALKPYQDAKKVSAFTGAVELVPGIHTQPSHGHTAGHTNYVIESGGQRLVLWGDLLHAAAVQFPEPEVTIGFDTDSKDALAERKKALKAAAKSGDLIGIAHVSFPGLGHVRAEGKGFAWVPLNYSSAVAQ